ncbi:MAG: hypothetical protein LBU17_02420 [Treponema sp.]|nr:hypothetical protein [Treponema sp.]
MNRFHTIIGGLVLPILLASSCSTESAIQQILGVIGVSAEAPVFLSCKAVSPREIDFRFSLPVRVLSLNFDPPLEVQSMSEGDVVAVTLERGLNGGEPLTADILVEDEHRNTLNVLVPLRARNDRLPLLTITELRTEYAKPKVEFVEFKTRSAGNLGALRLFIAGNGLDQPIFEFPPAEVQAGEYIVVHLRSLEVGLVNETGTDLGLSAGTEAFPGSRDFWVPDAKERFRKTDAVFFLDQDDLVLDGVLLSESPDTPWAKAEVAAAAELLGKQGAWLCSGKDSIPGPGDAVESKATTVTRSISRNEALPDSHHASDWYITASSSATPGKPNSTKKYEPK